MEPTEDMSAPAIPFTYQVTAVSVEVVVSERVTVAVKSKEVLMGTSVVVVGVMAIPVIVALPLLPPLPPQADKASAAPIAAATRRSAEILLGIRAFPSGHSRERRKKEARPAGPACAPASAS